MKNLVCPSSVLLFIAGNIFMFLSCAGDNQIADAYGNFEAEEVLVSAQVQGILKYFDTDEGDVLDENQLAGIIDTTDVVVKRQQIVAQLTVIQARMQNLGAQLRVQQAQRSNLLREVNRINILLQDQAATQQQYDDIEGKLQVQDLQIQTLESQQQIILAERSVLLEQLTDVNNLIDKCSINNPVAGTVLETYIEEGELAVPGKAMYKIANLAEMELRFYISGDQLTSVSIGDSILVAIDMPDDRVETLTGMVTWISSEVEFTPKIIQTREERVNMVYAAKLRVENDGRIKIGMPGEVFFIKNNVE